MRGAGYAFDGDAAVKPSPEIPAQNPAALDPFWKNGRLTVSKEPVKTELSTEIFGYALSGLRQELHKFAEEIAAESNIDRRFVSFLQNTADLIPDTSPPQDVLFRLGHIEELFLGYAEIVNSEWPDFLAKRYRAIMLNYDRTMRQSSVWRNFKRNAALQTLSKDQTLAAKPLASEAASRLRQEEASQFVDPHVADALERLAESLKRSKLPPDVMEASYELLAIDLIESVNNTLKRIAEGALAVATASGRPLGRAGRTLAGAGGDYVKGVGAGLRKAAKREGPKDGEKAFKWLRRIVITSAVGGGVVQAGAFTQLAQLMAKYPNAFEWLERILHYMK